MTLSKTIFRQNSLKTLKNSSIHNRLYKTSLVNKKLLNLLKSKKRLKILFYYPLDMEVNILKSLVKLRKKHDIYIPFMVEQSFKMVPFRLPLRRKKFNIYEAGNTNRIIKKIDIAVVPVVGVDGNLQRVGFGKGMYDRFFEKLPKRPYIIFTQLELCYTKEFICDDHDISCDILITPKKTIGKI
ncbi:MAG: 5-formyltetrahydrofolate cyclo-ligase [Sulfurimonas sp.]|nr:5-formyltetrahydrofolate cyclo-ligase [Sulfurimonas sp.]MDQ7067647.1 5-formyltetrahydrofolate cyclo-ligase [Sulfurimonas sp.]